MKEKILYALKHVPQYIINMYHGEYDHPVWVQMPPPEGNGQVRNILFTHLNMRSESNLEKWLRAMDFSHIEELHLAQQEKVFYELMRDGLPSLKRLSVDWSNSGSNVVDERVKFLESVPPLEALSIEFSAPYCYIEGAKNRTRFPLEQILERHGQSLQSLVLKQRESHDAHLRRPMLSVVEIDAVGESCPQLYHLGLDIDRDASYGWPNKTFDALSRITSLNSLTLRLEIGADLHDSSEHGEYGWNPDGIDGPGPFREVRIQ